MDRRSWLKRDRAFRATTAFPRSAASIPLGRKEDGSAMAYDDAAQDDFCEFLRAVADLADRDGHGSVTSRSFSF
jgi:hypothetical protein